MPLTPLRGSPDGSMRSPDLSWIRKEKWGKLSLEEQQKFAPVCPDFVIELRSKSDSLNQLKSKMLKWIGNGCQLAWLIDSIEQKAYVYSSMLETPKEFGFNEKLSGGDLLPRFYIVGFIELK